MKIIKNIKSLFDDKPVGWVKLDLEEVQNICQDLIDAGFNSHKNSKVYPIIQIPFQHISSNRYV